MQNDLLNFGNDNKENDYKGLRELSLIQAPKGE